MHVIYTHVRGGAEALKDLVGWLVGGTLGNVGQAREGPGLKLYKGPHNF